MQVEYRNCNYIGSFNQQNYHRQGYGMLLLDNSQIIMGKWKADAINGPFFIINDRMRVLGTMLNNKLQGYNVISLQESLVSNRSEKQRTIFGMFRDNKIYGKAIIIDEDQLIVAHYTNGELRQITQKKQIKDREVYDLLSMCFPNEIYNIADWLTFIFEQATKQSAPESKYIPIMRSFGQEMIFYGYAEAFAKNRGLGFVMNRGEVVTVGEHDDDYLQGIGRAYYANGTVEDGVFKDGQLNGIGISYSKVNHKYILGEHQSANQSFEKGFGFPQKDINEIRREFHLRSINFYNDIVLLSFATVFQAILANCLQSGIQNESPRFSSLNNQMQQMPQQKRKGIPQKSPLRAKIIEYQQQSDRIQQPSPMKNKVINKYDRVDTRKQRYFDSYVQSSEGDVRSQHQTSVSRKTKNQQNHSKNKQSSNSRTKSPAVKKVKDTRQLVRQLDEKQKLRRGYLDQIYKEAKIYSRKG